MGVANITELGNSVNVTDVLAAGISPALVKANCMMGLMHTEGLPQGTLTSKLGKLGTLTAASLAEATALAADANGELTDTSVSCTIAKCAVVTGVSVEQQQFGNNMSAGRIASEHGSAIARYVDNDALSLFSGLSTAVTSTSILTIDDVMLGQFNIFNSECPNKEVALKAVLSHRGHYNIKKEITQSGASVWTNSTVLSILGGAPQQNCYVGSLGSIDFYATSGHATSGGDTVQAIFHPMWCFAGFFAPSPVTWVENEGRGGFFTAYATYYFYDVLEWNDACGVKLLSDS
jgi:hypothetical protein